ncbi:IMP dehydrogenase [Candidatus Vesicomyidisocius calyptogenae]|uniref:Inosine-5'-monophosphate dehydrogenase n=1 Tax=Vesicomyosocius okutanii subsp. Calyptogena okutanii (strain HA) TaxID=412965 RepID=A5CWW9_VESOH|nr:IMP dehydrogenase [Candidatus Vesicomyosocius okutanii]BAF61546.1 IMP dehydrogenase [Candidatus Vesicomyosocius okutanii]
MNLLKTAYTFDDVLLVPEYSKIIPKKVNLITQLTKNITLNIPILSAAMDTVTESKLAIAIAQEGGIGIIHKNISVEEQANEVHRVKRFESGIIKEPITISLKATIADVLKMQQQYNISALPVVEGNTIKGLVTGRDVRFKTRLNELVKNVMTPQNKLITVKEGTNINKVRSLLQKHRIERIIITDDTFNLKGMINVSDIQKSTDFPNACKDSEERLRVGAAVGVGAGTSKRIDALIEAGVDVIVIDTAHGHSQGVLNRVAETKNKHPNLSIIAGNIATGGAALDLIKAGADCVKVGIGPGSICTTRIVAGVGIPQISAISEVADALKDTGIPLIADGGIRYSGDIAKALAAGAYCVMLGSMLAGTEESPGEVELYQGRSYKSYRGMGSLGAMNQAHGSSDRYFQSDSKADKLVPEGVEGRVPFKGSIRPIIHQMIGGVKSSMGYIGCDTLEKMRTNSQFVQVTSAGMVESHVHDVSITKEASNYHQ